PAAVDRGEPGEARVVADLDAEGLGVAHQAITDVAGLVRDGEELAGLGFEREGNVERGLEEVLLLGQRPASEQVPHGGGGRRSDVARGVELGGKDVAAPATADEDLAAAVPGALEQHHFPSATCGMDGGHEARSAGADYDD